MIHPTLILISFRARRMIALRPSGDRRHVPTRGQETWRTFDAECSTDPLRLGFRSLESLNEESLAPGEGFELRPSKNTEVFTYVREGTLTEEDPSGRSKVLEMGECRCVTVGSGTTHRAVNRSLTAYAHAFQCCITPDGKDLKSRSQQRRFPVAERRGILRLTVSPDGKDGSLRMHQDIRVYSSLMDPGHHLIHELAPRRAAWLHVVKGRIQLIDQSLGAGDGASLVDEAAVSWTAVEPSEILLFDLA
jgi:quercetin 2,3-dioxygenase